MSLKWDTMSFTIRRWEQTGYQYGTIDASRNGVTLKVIWSDTVEYDRDEIQMLDTGLTIIDRRISASMFLDLEEQWQDVVKHYRSWHDNGLPW